MLTAGDRGDFDLLQSQVDSLAIFVFLQYLVWSRVQAIRAQTVYHSGATPGSMPRITLGIILVNTHIATFRSRFLVTRVARQLLQFPGCWILDKSSLAIQELLSEMHQLNLEDPIVVIQCRSRLATILRTTTDSLGGRLGRYQAEVNDSCYRVSPGAECCRNSEELVNPTASTSTVEHDTSTSNMGRGSPSSFRSPAQIGDSLGCGKQRIGPLRGEKPVPI